MMVVIFSCCRELFWHMIPIYSPILKGLDTLGPHEVHDLAGILIFVISNQKTLKLWNLFFRDDDHGLLPCEIM